mmetsp:Transcript_2861/g.5134  ORF Transcript_2861/g.5134 Transcript_2861/m.5134 type:complete len:362 (+) Transcript_2861:190-1275(+)
MDVEADLLETIVVEDVAAIKDESRLGHLLEDADIVVVLELVPLGDDDDGMGVLDGLLVRVGDGQVVVLGEEVDDLVVGHLGIIDVHLGTLVEEEADDRDSARLTRVSSVLLEGESQHSQLLVSHCAVHRLEDAHREPLLLELVDVDDGFKVLSDLIELVRFGNVDKSHDVLLEARTTKADAGAEVAVANATVHTKDTRDLSDIGTRLLADGAEGVDAGDALGEEGVAGEFGELTGPEVGGDDLLLSDPVAVDVDDLGDGDLSLGRAVASDKNAHGILEITDGAALSKELGVRDDLELDVVALVGLEDRVDLLGRSKGHGALLDDDLVRLSGSSDRARDSLPGGHIKGLAGTTAIELGGCVD